VVFTEEPEAISPLMLGKSKDVEAFSLDAANSGGSKHRIPKLMHKVSRRFSHLTASPSLRPTLLERTSSTNGPDVDAHVPAQIHQGLQETFMQMHEWIQDERAKRKTKGLARMPSNDGGWNSRTPMSYDGAYDGASHSAHDGGEMSDPLDRLEGILDKGMLLANIERSFLRKASLIPRRSSTFKRLRAQSTVGSDDNESDEGYVPTCEAILDNSKTLSFTGGASDSQSIQPDSKKVASKSKDAWTSFKYEILRLAHTLKLKGWRRVPFEMSDEIDVERLSGALTNAVYVVSPPPELPQKLSKASDSTTSLVPRKAPIKLLLRIYGPQSEHLIDRDAELQILRRLAKQHIGPSLLGTFTNGRFEEFLHARTLKPQDLRMPDTSKQIAKRMRELHDGIELLEEERDGGPFVWKNWDCWVERCEEVVQYLDKQVLTGDTHPRLARLKGESLICCVEWKVFQGVVEKFRAWLDERYGGASKLREQLIFAHNDVSTDAMNRATLISYRHSTETSSDWYHRANLHCSSPRMSTSSLWSSISNMLTQIWSDLSSQITS
jgi:choline kinase